MGGGCTQQDRVDLRLVTLDGDPQIIQRIPFPRLIAGERVQRALLALYLELVRGVVCLSAGDSGFELSPGEWVLDGGDHLGRDDHRGFAAAVGVCVRRDFCADVCVRAAGGCRVDSCGEDASLNR